MCPGPLNLSSPRNWHVPAPNRSVKLQVLSPRSNVRTGPFYSSPRASPSQRCHERFEKPTSPKSPDTRLHPFFHSTSFYAFEVHSSSSSLHLRCDVFSCGPHLVIISYPLSFSSSPISKYDYAWRSQINARLRRLTQGSI